MQIKFFIYCTIKSTYDQNQGCGQIWVWVRGPNLGYQFFFFFGLHSLYYLTGCLMTSFLPSTGRSLDCLLPDPGLMPQSLSSEVSDVRPAHHDSTELADPLLGVVKLTLVRVILQPTSLCVANAHTSQLVGCHHWVIKSLTTKN